MRRYVTWVIDHRILVIILTLVVTLGLASQIRYLHVIIDPNALAPSHHPYVVASDRVEQLLGSKYVVLVSLTPKHGDIYNPVVLGKVQRITAALVEPPNRV